MTVSTITDGFVLGVLRLLGRMVLGALGHIGRFSLMCGEVIRALAEWRVWLPRTISECADIGWGSLPIVTSIAVFVGAVTAIQAAYQWQSNLPFYILGTVIVTNVLLELGPVLTGLVLAGRMGARYAAELGTMRVTEQIDGLESLGRSPYSHLIVPRVLAGFVMVPVLTVIADVVGTLVAWYAVKQLLPVTDEDFTYGAQSYYRNFDAYYSVITAFCYGGTIALIACYSGFNTKQGAEGVGQSTTTAVVISSVSILMLNVVLANLLLNQ
jgi:phospholipid/cholesterol/gamma-HCH transport system permease protein